MGPVTDFKAGDIVKVRFWNHQVGEEDKFPRRGGLSQSRHGGGACEFSLSYNKGKTWKVIGQYTKTCPDIYYEWPVQIPPNVPSCSDPDKCLFAMSWVSYATNQFYHHCSNVRIKGKSNGKLPLLDMTIVDVKQLGQKMNVHALGDKKRGKSSGPNARERRQNTNGFYAYGGGAGKKGINLGLIYG
ncbi:hypothetical protein BGX34_011642 [Mortierella sp. NVP85]|nr:hypothetical protein BGX34_011642 [Mortierella sp. NVP85]